MTGLDSRISGVRSDCSTNCATTHYSIKFLSQSGWGPKITQYPKVGVIVRHQGSIHSINTRRAL